MPPCPNCAETVIEYDASRGNGFCVACGCVVEENTIVSEITFGESSSGAAMAHGSFVAQGQTRARMTGKYAGQGQESREQVIENGRRRISEVAHAMRLNESISDAAQRWFNLCINQNFIKGRRSIHVAAVCLYVSCRMKETSHMLIDFSDKLRVNVFQLGSTYLKMIQVLSIQLPVIDPAHYISRFAALLEFGEETRNVAKDAMRLVSRMDRDWMRTGRRPSGVCGASLLLAARMNNFRRSVEEIVQIVKISNTTIEKRLEEFRNTPSGALTVQDFRDMWLEDAADPPAFSRAKKRRLRAEGGNEGDDSEDEELGDEVEGESGEESGTRHKRLRTTMEGASVPVGTNLPTAPEGEVDAQSPNVLTPISLNQGILRYALDSNTEANPPPHVPLFNDATPEPEDEFDAFLNAGTGHIPDDIDKSDEEQEKGDGDKDAKLAADVEARLVAYSQLPETELDQKTIGNASGVRSGSEEGDDGADLEVKVPEEPADPLDDLDESELDAYLLNDEEAQKKGRLWVEFNKEYLEAIAAKSLNEELGQTQQRKPRKKASKPRDENTPAGSTPVESTKAMIKEKKGKFSKRINYSVIENMFASEFPKGKRTKKAAAVVHAEEKDEEEKGDEVEDEVLQPDGAENDFSNQYYDNFEGDGYQEEV